MSRLLTSLVFLLPLAVSAQHGSLKGDVVNEKGVTISGATIRLEPDRHMTQSDARGHFLVQGLYEGDYTLYVSNIGFRTDTQQVSIQEGGMREMRIVLYHGVQEMEGVVVAAESGSVNQDDLLNPQRSAMPVVVITRETIEKMGSRRLDELLKEQTGLAVVNDISGGARATGIQLQGFSSDYVMVLIDGQPMVGRNSGSFDLSRISITNIERIEIIKGASSCLWGSDALGGAINIITIHGSVEPQARAALQYGSLHIIDATLEGETPFASHRGSANLSANFYRTDGYNTDKQYISNGTTAPPYNDLSVQGRARYRISKDGTIGLTGRYALRRSFMSKVFGGGSSANTSGDQQNLEDFNGSVYYNHRFSSRLQGMSRYYLTVYGSDMSVAWQDGSEASSEQFTQTLHRMEQQLAYRLSSRLKFTGGLGGSLEHMSTSAYAQAANMTTEFGYLEGEWQIREGSALVGGLRYDRHNSYGGRLNPSLGLQQKLSPWLQGKIAFGSGYKTPDFKSLYQVFVNPVSNYMVVGSQVLTQTLADLEAAGKISEIRETLLKQLSGNLQPERSTSYNLGLIFSRGSSWKIETGVFYHSLRNQINSIRVATGANNLQIFTWQNLPRSVNKGAELSFNWKAFPALEISGGYQYLVAKDLSVADSILSGNYPWNKIRNNATGETRVSKPSDYWGLENRSRHMANLRVFYSWEKLGLNASFRVNYRGKYPFGDANNNGFIDKYDTFVDGFFLLNAAIEKQLLRRRLSLRLTVDNMLDYSDRLMPAQPGRVVLAGVVFHFMK